MTADATTLSDAALFAHLKEKTDLVSRNLWACGISFVKRDN
jgi:hypothetical protein